MNTHGAMGDKAQVVYSLGLSCNDWLLVLSADPPLLRGTTNSTVCAKLSSSERSAATLECAVQERDGEARVQWARGGQVLRSGAKYVIPKEPIREAGGMLVFLLIVRELTEADVGVYECQLFSNFSGNRPEATRRVWINGKTLYCCCLCLHSTAQYQATFHYHSSHSHYI